MTTAETIMNQAGYTAEVWMKAAVEAIDNQFGEGYAKAHPELVGSFMQAAAADQSGMYLRKIGELLEENLGLGE